MGSGKIFISWEKIAFNLLRMLSVQEEGSVMGFKEFKINFQRIREGLKRSSDTAKIQEEIENEERSIRRM